MSRKLAVLIGVRHVDGLPQLSGIRSGLDGFEKWAMSQGFEAVRFDDLKKDRAVSLRDIRDTIENAINDGDVEKLFVYFAGHGIIRGYGEEYWLLSEAAAHEDEAVNVFKSVRMSFYQGFGHVAFFGDACSRVAPGKFSHVSGLSVAVQPE